MSGQRLVAIGMVALGAFVLLAVLAYVMYGVWARSRLWNLVAEAPGELPGSLGASRSATSDAKPAPENALEGSVPQGLKGSQGESPSSIPLMRLGVPSVSLYPGQEIAPQFWPSPMWAQPMDDDALLIGYLPPDRGALAAPGTLGRPQRVRIPLIELDSSVKGLGIIDLGDSRQYETPAFVVGHIPETPNPGERGNAWFFGHLQTPLSQEGAIFKDLPKIPELLRQGRKVYVIVDSSSGSFLYRVTTTEVVPGGDLRITHSEDVRATLVTCVPALTYSHRLVVTAELVGVKAQPSA